MAPSATTAGVLGVNVAIRLTFENDSRIGVERRERKKGLAQYPPDYFNLSIPRKIPRSYQDKYLNLFYFTQISNGK